MEIVSLDILKELADNPSQIKEGEGYSFKDIKEHYIEYRRNIVGQGKFEGDDVAWAIKNDMIRYLEGNDDIRYVGEGSSRISYALGGGDCLKVAHNKAGIAQNYQEIKNTFNRKYDCFPKIKDYDRRYYGVILTECCSLFNDERHFDEVISDMYGVGDVQDFIEHLQYIMYYGFDVDRLLKDEEKEDSDTYRFVKRMMSSHEVQYRILRELIRFFKDNGGNDDQMCLTDLDNYQNWGLAIRDGKIVPVIIDAGFSDKICRKYYEESEGRLDENGEAYFIDDQDLCESVITEDRLSRELDLLKRKFKKGTVTFQYKKKSTGEKRVAHGTLNFKKMKRDGFVIRQIPNYISQRYKDHPNLFVYYDMDKHNWRCFDINNFTGLYR